MNISNEVALLVLAPIGFVIIGFFYGLGIASDTPDMPNKEIKKYILRGMGIGLAGYIFLAGIVFILSLVPTVPMRWLKIGLIVLGPLCLGGFIGESLKDRDYKGINWVGFGIGAALATPIPILCYFAGTFYWILHPLE